MALTRILHLVPAEVRNPKNTQEHSNRRRDSPGAKRPAWHCADKRSIYFKAVGCRSDISSTTRVYQPSFISIEKQGHNMFGRKPNSDPRFSKRSAGRKPSSSSRWTARSSPPTRISSTRSAIASRKSRASIIACSSTGRPRDSDEYRDFWAESQPRRVSVGRIQAHRQGRQGSLDPGLLQPDPRRSDKPVKVVKFATDITEAETPEGRRTRDRSRRSTRRRPSSSSISTAPSSPPTTISSKTLGYSLDEIKGKHHSMFVEPA